MIITKNIPVVSGIYKFTNKINNKCYIGQAQNLKVRVQGHINNSRLNKRNKHFYCSIQKHGIENFEVEILQEGKFTKQELDQMEITYIRLFKSQNQKLGYNIRVGGSTSTGFKHSEESKQLMSKNRKGKGSDKLKGRIKSEEHKKKISESKKGKPNYKMRGIVRSVEYRKKSSESHKGQKAWNKGLPSPYKGIKQSEEQKKKAINARMLNSFRRKLTELFYLELIKIT